MKRRLSDADELTFWHLGLHTSTGEARRALCSVHVGGGWAWASDSYRLLCAPVEAEWSGSVHRCDAISGGTVNVGSVPTLHFDSIVGKGTRRGSLTLPSDWVRTHLAPWGRRQVRFRADRELPPTVALMAPPSIWPAGPIMLPDGDDSGRRVVSADDAQPVAAVQAPSLAGSAVAVLDLSDTFGVDVRSLNPTSPLVLTPAGPYDPTESPFALVMPMLTDVTRWPHIGGERWLLCLTCRGAGEMAHHHDYATEWLACPDCQGVGSLRCDAEGHWFHGPDGVEHDPDDGPCEYPGGLVAPQDGER